MILQGFFNLEIFIVLEEVFKFLQEIVEIAMV
jgi:hypothetical protein